MKVGDKVVFIGRNDGSSLRTDVLWAADPLERVIYRVREIVTNPYDGQTCIRLENFCAGYTYSRRELATEIVYFQKLDTRPELSELTDEMILTAPATKELQTA